MSKIPEGYSIREMDSESFQPLLRKYSPIVFPRDGTAFFANQHFDETTKVKVKALSENMGKPYMLRLGVFFGEEFIGWHYGNQENSDTFYMRNSGILPEHQKKGLYSALLQKALEILKEKGFQKIYSRHVSTNNSVLIPKLKAGFLINSLEVSDTFGTLVHLTYYTNPLQRKFMMYRSGALAPTEDIRKILGT